MILANFHTHTTFCDGANTPEDVVLSAISKGFYALGFSEHSPIDFDPESGMRTDDIPRYKSEILSLKEKYKDKLQIFLGTEQDIASACPTDGYEYIIGSSHYAVADDGTPVTVDYSAQYLVSMVNRHFGRDVYSFCERYYEALEGVVERTNCDIIGHFDLVTKFNEKFCILDENEPRYIKAAKKTLEKLAAKGKIFEINTGAISRGHRTTPYPAPFILKRLAELDAKIILSADSHHKDTIDCHFEEAVKYAEKCGFSRDKIEKDTLDFINSLNKNF